MQKRNDDKDSFIDQLKTETKSLRDEVKSLKDKVTEGTTAAELLDRIQTQQSENTNDKTDVDVEELRKQIAADIKNSLESDGLAKVQADNLAEATLAAQEAFGEGYGQVVQTKLSEIGMTTDQLNELAKVNPNAATKLLGIEEKKSSKPFDSTGTINTQSVKAPETTTAPQNMMGGASEKDITDRLKYHRQRVLNQN